MMIVDVSRFDQPGAPRDACGKNCGLPWAWLPEHRGVFILNGSGISFVPEAGGAVTETAKVDKMIYQTVPSPDGHWITVLYNGLRIARLDNSKMPDRSEWKLVAKDGDLPRWSPDGNTLYYLSTKDQFRCIWAVRLNPSTKEAIGEPFPVYHSHAARYSMQGLADSGAVGLGVARDKIVFAQAERSGNIWIGKLEK
jgi:hypothetical protein